MENNSREIKMIIIQNYLNEQNIKYYTILSNIIEKYNLEHSTNMNGIFLNLTMLDEDILNSIYFNFINSDNVTDVIQENFKDSKTPNVETNKFEKDKLILDIFDKFLLKQSRSNITI